MGFALAHEAVRRGARVTLVLGPVPEIPSPVARLRVISVESAREMDAAVQKRLAGTDIFIGAAAVSDFRPSQVHRQKLKGKPARVRLDLVRNPDILARAAKPGRRRPTCVIGFALETSTLLANARKKLMQKNLDWIVANKASNLASARGRVTVISRTGRRWALAKMSKGALAGKIWDIVTAAMSNE